MSIVRFGANQRLIKQNLIMKDLFKKMLVATLLFMLTFVVSKAQTDGIPRKQSNFDLALGAGSGIYSAALSWNRTHGIFKSNKLRLGYGVRLSSFGGSDLTYITAPADLTEQDATIDTLQVLSVVSFALNTVIHIQYQFSTKFSAGFNIDAFGLGFGPSQQTTFITSAEPGSNFNETQQAQPTPYNLLLGFDNDIGTLKSEFFVKYQLSQQWGLRGGMDMTFSEYTTDQELTHQNDRFRYKAMLFFAGISFSPIN